MSKKKIYEMSDDELKRRALERSERQYRIRRVAFIIRMGIFVVVIIFLLVLMYFANHSTQLLNPENYL